MSIYVLRTEEGKPPRALVGEWPEPRPSDALAVFSHDTGCWMINGIPVPDELGDAITAHARSLGVEAFL